MERIRANILTRLGLTEPLDSGEPLTVDEEAVVAAFREYQMANEGWRVHTKDNSAIVAIDLLDNCINKVHVKLVCLLLSEKIDT